MLFMERKGVFLPSFLHSQASQDAVSFLSVTMSEAGAPANTGLYLPLCYQPGRKMSP